MNYTDKERRANYPMLEKDIYDMDNIKEAIQKERRKDELDRLQEVKEQKTTWLKTVAFCALLNLILISLGLWGIFK